MKRKYLTLALLILLMIALAACLPPNWEAEPPTQAPTLEVQPGETIAPAPVTPTLTTVDPPTPTPDATARPVPGGDPATGDPAPANQDPRMVTTEVTNVRRGPDLAYEVSHVLSAGTTAPILGRNAASDWWAVPGPGDGPGPVGWVAGAVVAVQGDVSGVPVLPAPPLSPDVPVMGNAGQPGAEGCTVAHPGPGDTGPLYVYKIPEEDASAIVAQLGLNRWAVVIGRDNDWYRIQDADGVAGWVPVAHVTHNGLCQPDEGPGSVPLVEDPGAPPSNTCVASRPGQFPPPDIHASPGRHFGLIARLGNWAEVLKSEMGWHQILLGPTQVGWVDGEDVDLIGPCPDAGPTPERIGFPSGATAVELEGILEPPRRDFYLFRALAGQRAAIEIVSDSDQANFALSGVSDGQPYKRLEDELRSWSAVLPQRQDYLLTVAAPAGAPATEYRLLLTIEPLEPAS